MYRVTGWVDGYPEVLWMDWDEVQSMVQCLEPGMYRAVLVVDMATGTEVFSYTFD